MEDLVDEQLAFAIGIARVDHQLDPREEPLDGLEEIRCLDGELPGGRPDGQVFELPPLEFGVVRVGVSELEDVASTPGDDVGAAFDVVVAAPGLRKHLGNRPRQGGFFGDEQAAHGFVV